MSSLYPIQILLIAVTSVACNEQLAAFQKALDKAQLDLQWIQDALGHESDDIVLRHRRNSINDVLASFQFEKAFYDDLESGDAWYRAFRAKECHYGHCPKKGASSAAFERAAASKKSKNIQTESENEVEDEEYDEGFRSVLDDYDSLLADDQMDHSKNDLSHEANYKLSKIEQDESAKMVLQANRSRFGEDHFNFRRSLDPMAEIELKTSNRLMLKGYGASLPSNSLVQYREDLSNKNILKKSTNNEPIQTIRSRRLLSTDDLDYDFGNTKDNSQLCGPKGCKNNDFDLYDTARSLGGNQFDNLKQKNPKLSSLDGIQFDNIDGLNEEEPVKTKPKKNDKSLILSLSDDLFNSPAFVKLESLLKGTFSSSKNQSSKSTTTPRPTATKLTSSTPIMPTPKTTTTQPIPTNPLNLSEKGAKSINIKLQMTVNATIPKDSSLSKQSFHKNSTIQFNQQPQVIEDDDLFGRERRGIIFPILKSSIKHNTNDDINKAVREASEEIPLDELITGKLTSEMVKTIFTLVRTTPALKVLWPSLKRNKPTTCKQVKNFYAIRNMENESEMHRTEVMLQKAMETINAIIEQQVRSRTCIPLRPDLQKFYEQILVSRAEADRSREKRTADRRDAFSRETRQVDASKINSKVRVVKKLLGQYEDLSLQDQYQQQPIKDSLLMDLVYLRKLQMAQDRLHERKKREMLMMELQNTTNSVQDPQNEMTPQYLKLLRAVELLREGDVEVD